MDASALAALLRYGASIPPLATFRELLNTAGCSLTFLAPSLPGAGRRLFLLQTSNGAVPLIFAAGNLRRDGSLQEHFDKGSANLPLLATSADGGGSGEVVEDSTDNASLKAVRAVRAAPGHFTPRSAALLHPWCQLTCPRSCGCGVAGCAPHHTAGCWG